MRAIILAAGRGERMKHLTRDLPKPLLPIAGKPMIEYLLERLSNAGLREIVINVAYRGEQIRAALGDGARFNVAIEYSDESDGALETGGGMYAALPLLGDQSFIAINGDVWTDFDFADLTPVKLGAHLVLVPNPPHHPRGDFHLAGDQVTAAGEPLLTFSGIGVYHPTLFSGCQAGRFPIAPLLRDHIAEGLVTGQCYRGVWFDVGTPERLTSVNAYVAMQQSEEKPV